MVRLRGYRRGSRYGSSKQQQRRSLRDSNGDDSYEKIGGGSGGSGRISPGCVVKLLVGIAIGIYLVNRHGNQMDDTLALLNSVKITVGDDEESSSKRHRQATQKTTTGGKIVGREKSGFPSKTTFKKTATTSSAKTTSSTTGSSSAKDTSKMNLVDLANQKKFVKRDMREITSSVSSNSFPLPATNGKVWFWIPKQTTDSAGGYTSSWDHVRQGMMVTWMIAYFTGHSMEHKPPMKQYKHYDFWSPSTLAKYVNVEVVPYDADTKHKRKGLTRITSNMTFNSVEEVQALVGRENIGYYGQKFGWNYLLATFPWLDPFGGGAYSATPFRRMMNSFTYTEKIQILADRVIEQMMGTDEVDKIGNFVGMEMKLNRKPAVDCTEYSSESYPADYDLSQHTSNRNKTVQLLAGACVDVDWHNVVQRSKHLLPQVQLGTTPVYVAHDLPKGEIVDKNEIKVAKLYQRADFDFLLPKYKSHVISAVEQIIMIRAKYFIPSVHSPWSEYCVFKRIYSTNAQNTDARKNYQIWKDKFASVVPPIVQEQPIVPFQKQQQQEQQQQR